MAEESGKGVALVILGIVAIIAIVGLVLLFTGARKAAVGEFAVPSAKEYGGAIRGVYDPYSRAFSGRAMEFPSGQVETFSAQWPGSQGVLVGGEAYGDVSQPRGEQYQNRVTYNRQAESTPSVQTTCNQLSSWSGQPGRFTEPASVQEKNNAESLGRSCMNVQDMVSVIYRVNADQYGLAREAYESYGSLGVVWCCEAASLGGLV
ncbi:hypothetical protein J4219_00075 [Candidatus Woesearchaeota archaeon]|nr:hypothetical protein [Candidatus Woesearchaeota archaeon]